jgi:hypothetical protein
MGDEQAQVSAFHGVGDKNLVGDEKNPPQKQGSREIVNAE